MVDRGLFNWPVILKNYQWNNKFLDDFATTQNTIFKASTKAKEVSCLGSTPCGVMIKIRYNQVCFGKVLVRKEKSTHSIWHLPNFASLENFIMTKRNQAAAITKF